MLIVGATKVISNPFMRICVLAPLVSFVIGCVSKTPTLTGAVIKDPAQLSVGDTVLISIRATQAGLPVRVERPPEKIRADGTIDFYNLRVAGLTQHEAAIKIRNALIMDLYGVKIDEVNVVKVQPDGAANGSQPIRSETNRTSSAAGSRR